MSSITVQGTIKVTDLAIADEGPDLDTEEGLLAFCQEELRTDGVTIAVRDMGRQGVDGNWPHIDIEGTPLAVAKWLKEHYQTEQPYELWSLYGVPLYSNAFHVATVTMSKLEERLNSLKREGWDPIEVEHVGSRDWVVVCRRDPDHNPNHTS